MTCETCGQRPCVCIVPLRAKQVWIIQQCSIHGCTVAIRVKAGAQEPTPICKWHQLAPIGEGKPAWPDGMPDPEFPWPWLTDQERTWRIALPYWQERFRRHPIIYPAWIRQKIEAPGP